jgi:hypothetical protein
VAAIRLQARRLNRSSILLNRSREPGREAAVSNPRWSDGNHATCVSKSGS